MNMIDQFHPPDRLLHYYPELGYGYFPVDEVIYGEDYFKKYAQMEGTEICEKINNFRTNIVNSYCPVSEKVLDVGIGAGTFIKYRGINYCFGYDINDSVKEWLRENKIWYDPLYSNLVKDNITGITFFDSFEHISDHTLFFNIITNQYIFISIPIFKDGDSIINSKHFRKDEHYHYFTMIGIIAYFKQQGFALLEIRDDESRFGREDIYTFVFKRR